MSDEMARLEAGIAALEAQRALLGDAVVDAALAGLRAKMAALAAPPAEPVQALKQVTILFLDVVGSTTLSQHLDPEEICAVMDGALARGTTVVESHRGRVLQYAGDNLLAAFGTGESREDDPERAVRCGLDLLALGKALGAEVRAAHGHAGFDVRVGIHTGGVLLGGGVDDADSIRGIAVNIAARMEETAPAGALRISHDTYALVRGVFDVAPQEPMTIKGVDAPVTSYLVLRAKPRAFRVAARGIEGVATRMIGRDAELETLQDAFKRVVRPGAGFERALVVADAGVGKSRLLDEFRNWAEARAERFVVFQARATPEMQGQPYGMLRDMLAWRFQVADHDSMDDAKRKLEEGLRPLVTENGDRDEADAHAHLLGQLIGLDYHDSPHIRDIADDGKQIRNRGFHAAALAMRRVGADGRPVVAYLDDVHWSDDASLDFFDYLAQVNRAVPTLVVAFTRPTLFERRAVAAGAADGGATTRIDLRPLDRGMSRYLADELLKKLPEIPQALREMLTAGADGNPFYMEELVKMLVDQGAIDTRGDAWSLDADRLRSLKVPPTLTGVLQARLDGLPSTERQALQLASVIGLHFWDAALAHVEPHAAAQIPPLTKRELFNPTDANAFDVDDIREYAFRHQILHQVTYDTVLKRIRREAHAKAGEWLAEHSGLRAKGLLGTAAEHYERADDPANAAECYPRAAEYPASTFDNQAALDYVARALKLAPADAHAMRWRLVAVRERTLDLLGRRAEQMQDVDALAAFADALDDDAKRAEAAWRRCDVAIRTADFQAGIHAGARALAFAERSGDAMLTMRAMQRYAVAMAFGGQPLDGRALAEDGLARARAADSKAMQSRFARALVLCADVMGHRSVRLAYCMTDLECTRQTGDRRGEAVALINAGEITADLGCLDQARGYLEDALKLNRTLGNREAEGITLAVLSDLAWRQEEDALALTRAEAAVAILREIASRFHLANALWSLGNAELALGRYDAAMAAFRESEALSPETGQRDVAINALEGQARVGLARRHVHVAARLVDELLSVAGVAGPVGDGARDALAGTNDHVVRLTMVRVWLAMGDPRSHPMLGAASRLLHDEAATIDDPVHRRRFLEDIPEHRALVALARQHAVG